MIINNRNTSSYVHYDFSHYSDQLYPWNCNNHLYPLKNNSRHHNSLSYNTYHYSSNSNHSKELGD